MLKEILEEVKNEGIIGDLFNKGLNYLIKNTNLVKKWYTNSQKKYGRLNPKYVENPKNDFKVLRYEGDFIYFTIKTAKKDYLCMCNKNDKKVGNDFNNAIETNKPQFISLAPMKELENNGIIPHYILKIVEKK